MKHYSTAMLAVSLTIIVGLSVQVVTSQDEGSQFKLWKSQAEAKARGGAHIVVLDHTGSTLVVGNRRLDTLSVWNVESDRLVPKFEIKGRPHPAAQSRKGERFFNVGFLPGDDGIVTGGDEFDYPCQLRIWDLEKGANTEDFADHPAAINQSITAAETGIVVTCDEKSSVRVIDLKSKKELRSVGPVVDVTSGLYVREIRFSSDEKHLFVRCGASKEDLRKGMLRVFSIESLEEVGSYEHESYSVTCISPVPDHADEVLVAYGKLAAIVSWKTGHLVKVVATHDAVVSKAEIAPNSDTAITCDVDGEIQITGKDGAVKFSGNVNSGAVIALTVAAAPSDSLVAAVGTSEGEVFLLHGVAEK